MQERPNIFWGFVVIAMGLIFLGVNLGWWDMDVWSNIWRLWPVILIAAGLRKLVGNDALYSFLAVILLLLSLGWLLTMSNREKVMSTPLAPFVEKFAFDHNQKLSGETADFQSEVAVGALERFVIDLGRATEITITGADTDKVSVSLNGPKEFISEMSLSPSTSELVLRDEKSGSFGTWFSWGDNRVKGTVTMPKALALELKLSGATKITASDLANVLKVDNSGASTVTLANSTVQNPEIDLSGAGAITLDRCTGTGSIDVSGAGKVSAKACELSKLTAHLSGTGLIDIESGTIVDLDIEASGAGQVKLPKPSGKIDQDSSGVSKIEYR